MKTLRMWLTVPVLALALVAARGVTAAPPDGSNSDSSGSHGWLGVGLVGADNGVRVAEVSDGSPAARAGLSEGDVVLEINRAAVKAPADLVAIVAKLPAGSAVTLKLRRDGKERIETVTLGERPSHPECGMNPWRHFGKNFGRNFSKDFGKDFGETFDQELDGSPLPGGHRMPFFMGRLPKVHLGIQLQPLSEGLRGYFHAPSGQGVLVSDVVSGSPAEKAGLKAGDVILAVNTKPVQSHGDVIDALRELKAGDHATLRILREGGERTLDVTLEERPAEKSGSLLGPAGLGDFNFAMTPELTAEIHERLEQGMVQAREKLEKSRLKLERLREELPRKLTFAGLNPEI